MDEHFTPSAGLGLDEYIASGDRNAVFHLIRYLWAVECLADRPDVTRVLDFGCGAGYGSYLLAKRFPSTTVLGVDYDPAALEAARGAYALPNLRFAFGDGTQWEATIGTERFDCIVSFDSIEHIEHRELVMQSVVEHLEPAGLVLLSTPCAWASPVLAPGWEYHKIEYSLATLYDFLRRYFARIGRPDNGTLPHVEVFDRLRGTGMEYLLLLNPVVCEEPIRFDNPYRPMGGDHTAAVESLRVFSGDWGGWGVDMPGLLDLRTGIAQLVTPHGPNGTPIAFDVGIRGSRWTAVAGDWDGDGVDTIGAIDTATGEVVLLERNAPNALRQTSRLGELEPGWIPVAGDWNGDGRDTIGFFDPVTRAWRLRDTSERTTFDHVFFFGPALGGLVPFSGDWAGAGVDSVGVYSPASATFYLRIELQPGDPDLFVNFSVSGCLPVAGDWNGDGVDTIGVCNLDDRQFYLRNTHAPGPADICLPLPGAVEP